MFEHGARHATALRVRARSCTRSWRRGCRRRAGWRAGSACASTRFPSSATNTSCAAASPVCERVFADDVSRQCVGLSGAEDGLQDVPDLVGVVLAGGAMCNTRTLSNVRLSQAHWNVATSRRVLRGRRIHEHAVPALLSRSPAVPRRRRSTITISSVRVLRVHRRRSRRPTRRDRHRQRLRHPRRERVHRQRRAAGRPGACVVPALSEHDVWPRAFEVRGRHREGRQKGRDHRRQAEQPPAAVRRANGAAR